MKAIRQNSLTVEAPAPAAFQAALGVVQNIKNMDILAVHNEGQKLVAMEKAKMSNRKIYVIATESQGSNTVVHVAVGADPRQRQAVLDGKFNAKGASRFVDAVQGALSGEAPAPITPVPSHYLQKKEQVPWVDPNEEPDIQLGFSWLGLASYMN
ncbi:hypothetical protein [Solicola gregarius]|uniref:Uncharacterized protein n=1 Tax=Solicola gregarius TaxID=2908642 RepID=A0AA46TEX6_9ACTN|nr:hypothetical protein [Solicola gregarius]UYM03557.1 hypothetical protein L0C25_13420 [Solicola gregarius]